MVKLGAKLWDFLKFGSNANILFRMIQGIFALELNWKKIHNFASTLIQDVFHVRRIASKDLN